MSGSLLSALDAVLCRAKDVLLDFDGVVVRLYQADARARAAAWLRARLADPRPVDVRRVAPADWAEPEPGNPFLVSVRQCPLIELPLASCQGQHA
jgi:hypothetical protein